MPLQHCAIAISFSVSFGMSCRRRASSLKSQAARASTLSILREVSRDLVFQPSDRDPDALQSVAAWVKATRVANVRAPVVLDASQSPWPIASADGIICINMVHISPWDATLGLLRGAAAILPPTAPLYLYGPYKREGFATTPSNQVSTEAFAIATRPGVCETSKRSQRLRNPSDSRSRLSPRCQQTI